MKTMIFLFISIFLFIFSMIMKSEYDKEKDYEKVNYGTMTTIDYNGHSYTAWSYGYHGGLVHDPDCKCMKKK